MSHSKVNPAGPDLDTEAACRLLRHPPVSKETIYRLGKRGEIESYLVAGCRVWSRVSILDYIERQRALGAQFAPEVEQRRKPGRPKKIKPETSVAAE
jgi:hypothetical protein